MTWIKAAPLGRADSGTMFVQITGMEAWRLSLLILVRDVSLCFSNALALKDRGTARLHPQLLWDLSVYTTR